MHKTSCSADINFVWGYYNVIHAMALAGCQLPLIIDQQHCNTGCPYSSHFELQLTGKLLKYIIVAKLVRARTSSSNLCSSCRLKLETSHRGSRSDRLLYTTPIWAGLSHAARLITLARSWWCHNETYYLMYFELVSVFFRCPQQPEWTIARTDGHDLSYYLPR